MKTAAKAFEKPSSKGIDRWQTRMRKYFRQSPFFIKLKSWEYWPMHMVYVPVYAYYLFLSLRARSLFFFTSTNPGIETGGLYGDSKKNILDKIPEEFKPITGFAPRGSSSKQILKLLKEKKISFPIIAKPDIGERGFLVEKIRNELELDSYLKAHGGADLIIQEFVSFPEEVSVLYYRFPDDQTGHITSLTLKKFLSVEGNGKSTLRELIENYPRAVLQLETLEKRYSNRMDEVLPKGQHLELVSIGNHCRGTTFLDGTPFVDQQLVQTFDHISHQLPGIYFGRFDIKCQSLEDLKAGNNFKILEINGVKSEPTHIYDPNFSLFKAYGILFRQWSTIFKISKMNKAKGVAFMSHKEGLQKFSDWSRYKKTLGD